jgi:acetylornithine deacetylase/succinyl-diaminopimelate desuccinylase-like protein
MVEEIKQIIASAEFQENIISFLKDICEVDTSPRTDIEVMANQEQRVFQLIENRLLQLSFKDTQLIRKKIAPEIRENPAFSALHFTVKPDLPNGLGPDEVYRSRFNLLYYINGNQTEKAGRNPALNAHIDVVAPFFPPVGNGNIIMGRGVADDKGGVATICGALAVLDKLERDNRISVRNMITAMFVVEEETGGNGSLDLAIDKELKERYDSVLVLECAGNKIYPANRGAIWFRCKVMQPANKPAFPSNRVPSPFGGMIFGILEMQEEGDKIKAESNHPLFPHRPVQTCFGMLGPFGEHPSRICGYVSFVIQGVDSEAMKSDIMQNLQWGVEKYILNFGDKTLVIDEHTGKARVERHFDTTYNPAERLLTVQVFGSAGHMGTIQEHDGAITKMAFLAREVLLHKADQFPLLHVELDNQYPVHEIVLEGGQGFLPGHPIEMIMERMKDSFLRGVRKYLQHIHAGEEMLQCEVSFDKLHNNAFSCDPGSETFRNARDAAVQTGLISKEEPVRGWDVSCDARLFAGEYPLMPVLTTGPGELRFAHADDEQLNLQDLFTSIAFTSLYLLLETGSGHSATQA